MLFRSQNAMRNKIYRCIFLHLILCSIIIGERGRHIGKHVLIYLDENSIINMIYRKSRYKHPIDLIEYICGCSFLRKSVIA